MGFQRLRRLHASRQTSVLAILCVLSVLLDVVPAAPSSLSITLPKTVDISKLYVVDRSLIGWSFQVSDFPVYASSPLARNFFDAIAERTGVQPPIRVGGGVSDHTFWNASGTRSLASYLVNGEGGTQNVTLSPRYFATIDDYFSPETELTWCLNLNTTDNNFTAAVSTARAVIQYMGTASKSSLALAVFEIGNEPDFYGSRGWRSNETWNASRLTPQWFDVFDQVTALPTFKTSKNLTFLAGGFANPPSMIWNQFDVIGLLESGLVNPLVSAYSMHMYPQSGCSGPLSLPDLINHHYTMSNVSQYTPQITASHLVNAEFIIGEANSVSCGGRLGISDTFGAALWLVDYVLAAAAIDIKQVFFHATPHSPYSPFAPVAYGVKQPQFFPLAYGAYFVANVLAFNDSLHVSPLKDANLTDVSGYALYDSGAKLQKLVVLNTVFYDSVKKVRSTTKITLPTSWAAGTQLSLLTLQAPTTTSLTANVSNLTFEPATGEVATVISPTYLEVDANGHLTFTIQASEAILIQPGAANNTAPESIPNRATGVGISPTMTGGTTTSTNHKSAAPGRLSGGQAYNVMGLALMSLAALMR